MNSNALNNQDFRSNSIHKNVWKAVTILLLGLALTVIAAFYTNRQVEAQAKKDFASACNNIENKIFIRLHAHAQLLRSGSALFAASDTVTRKEWKSYTDHLNYQKNLPGIQGLGFSLNIPKNQLQQHIQNIRKEGFPDYIVRPVGKREVYTSVIYLEPFSGRNLRAFGYDTYSEPIRRKAMELSRDSDFAVLTGKVVLVQETSEDLQSGTLMFVPVYRKGMPVTNLDQRRAAIIGWVYSPYRMNDLMQGILGRWDLEEQERIHLQIYDDSISDASLLYDSQKSDRIIPKDFRSLTLTLPVEFHGKKWILNLTQSRHQITYSKGRVILVLVGGILISLLLFLLSLSLFQTRLRAMKIARNLTLNLKESESKFRMLFENMEEGFSFHEIITDENDQAVDFRFLDANAAYERHTGLRPSDCIGRTILEIMPQADLNQIKNYGEIATTGKSQVFDYYSNTFNRHIRVHAFSPKTRYFATIFEDITEQKLAEEAIKLSEARFRAILDNSYDAIGVHINGIWKICNPAALRMFGVSSDVELIGTSILNVIAPNEKKRISDFVQNRMKETNAPITYTTIGLKSDGTEFNMDVKLSSYELENKLHVLVILRDITEQMQADNALKESEERYKNLFENTGTSIIIVEEDTTISLANKRFLQRTGYTKEEVEGVKKWTEIVYKDDLVWMTEQHRKRREDPQYAIPSSFEFRYNSKSGELRDVLINIQMIPGTKKSLASLVDITDRKLVERSLIRSEELFRLFFSQSYMGFYFMMIDEPFEWNAATDKGKTLDTVFENLKFTKVNKAFLDQYHAIESDFIGKSLNDQFVDNLDYGRKIWTELLDCGKKIRIETNESTIDGKPVIIEGDYISMYDEQGKIFGIFGIQMDITYRKLAAAELELKNKELLKLNTEKDKFFSIISHDLRSPFNGFLGLTEIISTDLHQMTVDEIQEIAGLLNNSAKDLYNLLGNLLEWSRIQRDLIALVPESFLLLPCITEVLRSIMEIARNKKVYLHYEVPEDLMVNTDTNIFAGIIRNLTTNAVKFTRIGGQVSIAAKLISDNSVEISIKDTGIGMNEQMIENLFRLDGDTGRKGTEGEPSTGMGLIICKDLIEKLGSELHIKSEEGKGSEFSFIIQAGNVI